MEEIDLCWRLHTGGYEIYCLPQSTVYHVGGGTLPPSNPFKTYLNYRNSLAMLYKNLPSKNRFGIIFWRLVVDGISAVRFIPKGEWANIWAIIRAHFAFYKWIVGNLSQKREKIIVEIGQPKEAHFLPIAPKSVIWGYFVKGHKTFDSFSRL
jgi:GT2 family glycosyltransferase